MDEEKISNMERQPVSEMPKLVLDESELAPAAEAKPEITPVKLDESALTVEERQQVLEFSQRIDLNNSAAVLQYGAVAQKKIAGFSESALE